MFSCLCAVCNFSCDICSHWFIIIHMHKMLLSGARLRGEYFWLLPSPPPVTEREREREDRLIQEGAQLRKPGRQKQTEDDMRGYNSETFNSPVSCNVKSSRAQWRTGTECVVMHLQTLIGLNEPAGEALPSGWGGEDCQVTRHGKRTNQVSAPDTTPVFTHVADTNPKLHCSDLDLLLCCLESELTSFAVSRHDLWIQSKRLKW